MAATGTPTPNIGLRRPQGTDPASVDDINYNSNLIDTKLGAVGNTSVQAQINSLNSNSIKSTTISVTTNANGNVDTHIGGIVRAFATDSEHSSNCVAVPYTSAGLVRIFDNTFTPIANASVTLKVYYVTF